jgi:Ca2+-binding RTX toxin-like protein
MVSSKKLAAGISATLGTLLALAPTATARIDVSTSSSEGLVIAVSTTGSRVHVAPSSDGAALIVTEVNNAAMSPQSPCQNVGFSGESKVRCPRPSVNFLTFRSTANAVDRLTLLPGTGDCLCSGGPEDDVIKTADGADLIEGNGGDDQIDSGDGGDVLRGGPGNEILTGGPGNDSMDGGQNADTFAMGGLPDGADTIDGGDGIDTVSYAGRRGAVAVSLDDGANDGAPAGAGQLFGERDNVKFTVEELRGGGGNDVLTGNSLPQRLFGGDGNDTLHGGVGTQVDPSQPDDFLDGGLGSDSMRGEQGRDTLFTREAVDDQVNEALSCGAGADGLEADVRDDDTRPLPEDCEFADQGMVGEDPNVDIRSARRAQGGIDIVLRCPRKTRRGCDGRLAAKPAKESGRFGKGVRYGIKRGTRAVVHMPAVRARRVRIRSIERGRIGPRTTFATLPVSG